MLGRKLHSGTSTTKAGQDELVQLALFWKSHGCATGGPLMCDLVPCDRIMQRADDVNAKAMMRRTMVLLVRF